MGTAATIRSAGRRINATAPVEHLEQASAETAPRAVLRKRWSAALFGGGFAAAAAAFAVLLPSAGTVSPVVAAGLVVAYALAFRLDFEVGAGSAVPTQLVLVPMLFVLPLRGVPLAVAGGILLASLVDGARGRLRADRIAPWLANGWHSFGPTAVLVLAGDSEPRLGRWPVYVAALGAQFAVDFVIAGTRGWVAYGVRPAAQLRTAASVNLMDAALAPIGLAIAFATEQSPYAFALALPLVGLLSVFARERRDRIDHALELGNAYRGTAFLLGDVIEADDEYTGTHSRDVVELTLAVSDELGLKGQARRDAEFAALLHDVGKVRVPKEIINKSGPLSPSERDVMDKHTIEGERMLEQVGGLLGDVGRIVRSCHERFDGRGYPDGLAGEEIPLIARIVACCDAFNAMTSDRSYRKALPLEEAVRELRANSGTQFDPRVVDALISVVERDAA